MTQEGATPPGFWKAIERKIDERIARAMRSSPLRNTVISGGTGLTVGGGGALTVDGGRFRVKHPANTGGQDAVYVGDLVNGGVYSGTGLLVQSTNGRDMLMARYDLAFDGPRVEMYDAGSRVITGSDASSGQGLARPYLDSQPRLTRYGDWPTFTLAATDAWETVYSWSHTKQHPRLEVNVYASMDTAATTGALRIMVDGVQLGSDVALAFAQGPNFFGPANVAGSHMETLDVQVQIKRTTATGAVKLAPAYCRGRQSP